MSQIVLLRSLGFAGAPSASGQELALGALACDWAELQAIAAVLRAEA